VELLKIAARESFFGYPEARLSSAKDFPPKNLAD
jgi:hypothetical protein